MIHSTAASESDRVLPILLVLFIGSGCAALIYEIVWFELLRQVVGASSISLAIVLTSFMGGLFLGSWGFPRWVSLQRHPLKVYALLELAIGGIGLLMLVVLPLVGFFYIAAVGYGPTAILLRALVCLICLLPPTIMMGATLPAVARWMTTSRVGVSRMGFLYTANIIGAVGGTLLAGFYLLPQYDMLVATQVAAAINALVALLAVLLAKRAPYRTARLSVPVQAAQQRLTPELPPCIVHVAIGLSGLTALAAQVVWTRLASLLFGATVYTFTIILAVFLAGLAIGSSIGAYLARVTSRPAMLLGWSQLALVGAIPLAAWLINQVLPYWSLGPYWTLALEPSALQNDGIRFGFDLLRGSVAMLPATILWGASFPLALAAAARDAAEPGYLVGDIYAANTLGAIVGAMAFGLIMIPWIGTQHSQQVITVLAGTAALLLFVSTTPAAEAKPIARAGAIASWGGVIAVVALMASAVVPTEPRLIGLGHLASTRDRGHVYEFVGEGRSSSVALSQSETHRSLHVAGKVVTSSKPIDMRVTRLLGHLPALLHPDPKSVLIVGFGAGVTAGSFVRYPGIERIVICEIEPLVPRVSGPYFAEGNYDVLNDPRTEVIFDDARHFIATTDETFDIITSDPIHPWFRGAATLYSTEYFELVKAHLNPGGLVTQWVPPYQSTEAVVKSEIATFLTAFPDGTVWHTNLEDESYDLVLLGQEGPLEIDVVAVREKLDRNELVENSLIQVGYDSLERLLTAYTTQRSDLGPWLQDAQINHDRSLRLQYMAGLALHVFNSLPIYESLIRYRRYPDGIFIAPADEQAELRQAFEGRRIDLGVPNR